MWFRRAKKMWVTNVDRNGKQVGDGRWVYIPKPDRFATNGLAQIGGFVSRLRSSAARTSAVMVAAPDRRISVSLLQRDGVPVLSLLFEWRSESEREEAARQFFAERGLSTAHDYLGGNGGVPDAIRLLGYYLPPDVQLITTVTTDVLRQVYHLRDRDALEFTYQENNDPV
jgi:hypothetical protein